MYGRSRTAGSAAVSWLLVCSLLPSLLFVGHWQIALAIPGRGHAVALALAHPDASGHGDEAGGDHADHCHESAANCSDTPLTSISWIAHLSDAMAMIGFYGLLIGLCMAVWRPAGGSSLVPELPPPNAC